MALLDLVSTTRALLGEDSDFVDLGATVLERGLWRRFNVVKNGGRPPSDPSSSFHLLIGEKFKL